MTNPPADTPGRFSFENDEMPCAPCKKSTPHRLFGDMWRCSECGGVSSICATIPSPADTPVTEPESRPILPPLSEMRNMTPEEREEFDRMSRAGMKPVKIVPVVSGDDLGEALDAFQAAQRNYDDLCSLRFALNPASDSALASAHERVVAARSRIESLVAALRAENEKLAEQNVHLQLEAARQRVKPLVDEALAANEVRLEPRRTR